MLLKYVHVFCVGSLLFSKVSCFFMSCISGQRILAASYFASLVHVLPVVVAAVFQSYVIYNTHGFDIGASLRHENSDLIKYISAFLAGYMIYDFIEILRNEELYDVTFLVHHPISFLGALVGLFGYYEVLILPYYLGEIPVIFINLYMICSVCGIGSSYTVVLKLLAVFNFVLFRLSWTLILPFVFHQQCFTRGNCPHKLPIYILLSVFTTLSVLNYYWFGKQIYASFSAGSKLAHKKDT